MWDIALALCCRYLDDAVPPGLSLHTVPELALTTREQLLCCARIEFLSVLSCIMCLEL